jgi:hypothetical protein
MLGAIVNNAYPLQSDSIDYVYLRRLARSTGLWPGMATYLTVISDYAKKPLVEWGFPCPRLSLPQRGSEASAFISSETF